MRRWSPKIATRQATPEIGSSNGMLRRMQPSRGFRHVRIIVCGWYKLLSPYLARSAACAHSPDHPLPRPFPSRFPSRRRNKRDRRGRGLLAQITRTSRLAAHPERRRLVIIRDNSSRLRQAAVHREQKNREKQQRHPLRPEAPRLPRRHNKYRRCIRRFRLYDNERREHGRAGATAGPVLCFNVCGDAEREVSDTRGGYLEGQQAILPPTRR